MNHASRPARAGRAGSLVTAGALLTIVAIASRESRAEPAFAIRTGYSCAQCHVNRTGGGMRTPFGSLYAQTLLPDRLLQWKGRGYLFPADPQALVAAGGDLRAGYYLVHSEDDADTSTFDLSSAQVYGHLRLVPERFGLYLDQRLGAGGSSSREIFALLSFGKRRGYVKFGRFFPPYGWAVADDKSFIREPLGFAFSSSDVGIEIGFDPGRWSTQVAVVNGTAGPRDADRGKRITLLTARRFRHFTIGLTSAFDQAGGTDTTWAGILAGASFGRLSVLAERDARRTRTDDPAGRTRLAAGFAEVNLLLWRGMNLKFQHDWIDPSRTVRTDQRQRDSLGFEYVPYPFVQMRVFVRRSDGPPQVTGSRDTQGEVELHFFF